MVDQFMVLMTEIFHLSFFIKVFLLITTLELILESMFLFSGLGTLGSACATVKRFTEVDVNWPDISGIINSMDSIYDALKPMLDFFNKIRDALKKDLCIPNPIEALAELELVE